MNVESKNIQNIRTRYKKSLGEKAQSIAQYLHLLLDHTDISDELRNEIRNDLHKLAGSLGMYGYIDLAVVARKAMDEIETHNDIGLQQQLLTLRNLLQEHADS